MKISISRKVVCSRAGGAQGLWGSCPTSWNPREASQQRIYGKPPNNGFWVRGRKRHGEAAEDAGLWVREGRANLEDGPRLRHGYSTGSRHLVARRQRSTEPSAAARWRALLRAGFVLV